MPNRAQHVQRYIGLAAAVIAAFNGVVALVPLAPSVFHGHVPGQSFSPLHGTAARFSHLTSLALGFGLLYLANQLYRRKRRAYIIAVVTLALLLILSFVHHRRMWLVLSYLIGLTFLIMSRKNFSVRSDNLSMRQGMRSVLYVVVGAELYGVVGFLLLDQRAFGFEVSLWQAFKYTALQLVSFQGPVVTATSPVGRYFIQSIDVIGMVAFFLMITSLFRPIRFALTRRESDYEIARKIIQTSSRSTEDFFKLWPQDKHYYFSSTKQSVIAYGVEGRSALILDGPSGKHKEFMELLISFMHFAADNDWQVAIVHADESTRRLAEKCGLDGVFIGNEAIVNVQTFASETYRSKHFRYVHNKGTRDGLSVDVYQAPLSTKVLQELQAISDNWLGHDGRREYTFIMGYFDPEYLGSCEVAVLKQHGKAIAYCNVIPSYVQGARSIDHMRFMPDVPGAGMHFLLKELILRLAQEGVQRFNLGLSPLSGLEDRTDLNVTERALQVAKAVGARYYSFKGLEQFKNKFEPEWEPMYLLYKAPVNNLVLAGRSLTKLIAVPSSERRYRAIMLAAAVTAGLCFASFPLMYVLHIRPHELVSELGAGNQPFAWVFNTLDIASGILMIALGYTTLLRHAVSRQTVVWILWLYIVSGAGNILATLAALPVKEDASTIIEHLHDAIVAYHVVFSAVNILALWAAATLYLYIHRRSVIAWVTYAIFTIFGLTGFVFFGQIGSVSFIERTIIVTMGVWIVIIGRLAADRSRVQI